MHRVVAAADIPSGAVVVSDYEFNTFSFPSPVTNIFFPAGSPVVGKPVYLDGNTKVMLQLSKDSDHVVQAVFELKTGQVVTLRLAPRPVAGVSFSVKGPHLSSAPSRFTASGGGAEAPRMEDVALLKDVVSYGSPPSEFSSIALPAVVRFDKFSAIPLAAWSNDAKTVYEFSLVAVPGQTAVVAPPQFYRPGIGAVSINGDAVDATHSPTLYVVEDTGHGE